MRAGWGDCCISPSVSPSGCQLPRQREPLAQRESPGEIKQARFRSTAPLRAGGPGNRTKPTEIRTPAKRACGPALQCSASLKKRSAFWCPEFEYGKKQETAAAPDGDKLLFGAPAEIRTPDAPETARRRAAGYVPTRSPLTRQPLGDDMGVRSSNTAKNKKQQPPPMGTAAVWCSSGDSNSGHPA